ncbi:MAG: hypothetical protein WC809_06105 [Sinimarinibacterium sp.]|jgi:hypothetical protein
MKANSVGSIAIASILAVWATGAAADELDNLLDFSAASPVQIALPNATDAAVEASIHRQLDVIDSRMTTELAPQAGLRHAMGSTVVTTVELARR